MLEDILVRMILLYESPILLKFRINVTPLILQVTLP